MLSTALRIHKTINRFKAEWPSRLERVLTDAAPDVRDAIMIKTDERRHLAYSGAYVPVLLDVIGLDVSTNDADYLSSMMNIGIAMMDDATENVDEPTRRREFAWLESVAAGLAVDDGCPDDPMYSSRRAARHLLSHVVREVPDHYKTQFIECVSACHTSTLKDDLDVSEDFTARVQLGRIYGHMNYVLLESRAGLQVRPARDVFMHILGGAAIVDDMADVTEDYGVKMTVPVRMFNGTRPNPLSIITSGVIPISLRHANEEFVRAYAACPDEKSRAACRNMVRLIEGVYIVKAFEKSLKREYDILGNLI